MKTNPTPAPRKRKPKVVDVPLMEGMVEVTSRNHRRLEEELGHDIPKDVRFILMPKEMEDEDFWDIEKTCHIKREHRGETGMGVELLE